ncbi:hypothetical protein H2248_007714 [Termitomyces sp. 'cryptogamus']|nr:hypothetical protein H2248_007714 [Termitomyces sp. 'cryptogamus']
MTIMGLTCIQNKFFPQTGSTRKAFIPEVGQQCLGDVEHSILSLCTSEDEAIIGHAFATYWKCGSAQLVVRADHRRQGIASGLLRFLRTRSGSHSMPLA